MQTTLKHTTRALVADIIENSAPQTILSVGTNADELANLWCSAHPDTLSVNINIETISDSVKNHASADLAIVYGALETLTQHDGEQLLAMLRNYGTHQIAVLVKNNSVWQFNQFIALGFRKHTEISEDEQLYTLYTYNLDNYNHKRIWNNPRFWANPEMWNKARW